MARGVVDRNYRAARRVKLRDLHILGAMRNDGSCRYPTRDGAAFGIAGHLESRGRVWRAPLDRSPRGVEPTLYARTLLERTRVVFDELQQGMRDIAFLANPVAGDVTVGCPESLAAGFLPAVIERLSRHYPKVTVHVVTAQPGEQEFRELRERRVDVLLGRLFRSVTDDDIDVEVLADDHFFVTAGAASAFARQRRITLADLMDETWILFPVDSLPGRYVEAGFQSPGLGLPQKRLTSFSMQLRFHLLATGRFLTVLHRSVLTFNAKRWSLKALPIDLGVTPMPIVLFSLRHRTLSPVVQPFLQHVRAVARGMADSKRE